MSASSGVRLLATRRFGFLFAAQFLGIVSDNLAKSAIAVRLLFDAGEGSVAAVLATVLFILPYALFAPLAGRVADRFPKHLVARAVKLAEPPVMLFAGCALWSGDPVLMLVAMFLAGLQATLFSPVKYAMLPELVAADELVAANALIETGTFLAILAGTILGGLVGNLAAAPVAAVLLLAFSGLGMLAALRIPRTEIADPTIRLSIVPCAGTRQLLRDLRSWRRVHGAAVALSWFWMVGAILLSEVPSYARDVLRLGSAGASTLLVALVAGIGAGSAAYGAIAHRRSAGAVIPLGFLGMAVAIGGAALVTGGSALSTAAGMLWFFLAAFCGGLLSVPLYVALQDGAPEGSRARAVSGNNLLNAIYMVLGGAATAALAGAAPLLGLDATTGLRWILAGAAVAALVAVPRAAIGLPEAALGLFGRLLLLVHRVEVRGLEHLEDAGPAAVIAPNHVSWLDGALLAAALPGRPAFVVNTITARKWWVRWAIDLIEALRVDPTNPMAIKTLIHETRAGRRCVIFPEGRLTRTGGLMKIYEGPAVVADKADAALIPVRIEGTRRMIWSRLGGIYRRALFPKVTITVLPPTRLAADGAARGRQRREVLARALYDLMSDAAFKTFDAERTLFDALLDARREHGGRDIVGDAEGNRLDYDRLVGAAFVLGRKLARDTARGEAIGLLLPNAAATVAAFFGLGAFGRVPAMLNFSAGATALLSALDAAAIETVVTSRRFIALAKLGPVLERLGERATIVYLEDIKAEIGAAAKLRGLVDRAIARRRHRASGAAAGDPAVILFTSGSEGAPKGVVLSHRNLLANAGQAASRIAFNPTDVVLNALPLFHSFGLTAGLVLPVVSGVKTVLYPNPLHYRRVPELAYDVDATILFGTDTFLAGYAKRAHPYDFYSLRYVFAGAERVRDETRRLWARKFGVRLLEGYGATETGPVLALNTPMHNEEGTVGRLLPGIASRLEPVEGIARGFRLLVAGPNVMLGYLRPSAPGVVEAPKDGWYDTGDIVEIDGAGYVTILGRAKRFAKIAGEMVSLGAVEDWASALWPGFGHAATSLPDARKGERIVLLTTRPAASRAELAAHIRAHDLPEIATPSEIRFVAQIPVLGSGKTDYGAVRDIAARVHEGVA